MVGGAQSRVAAATEAATMATFNICMIPVRRIATPQKYKPSSYEVRYKRDTDHATRQYILLLVEHWFD